ncbi:hypothetical protein DM46_4636 [Burkholderia mallei]|nr:hypothetical protein DM46_4636 [Burkholderia mallei]
MLDLRTTDVIAAFQMHFRPARYDGVPDAETVAILDALLDKYIERDRQRLRAGRAAPVRKSIAQRTSIALPAHGASAWFMSVSVAAVLIPAPLPTSTMLRASSADCSALGMNAPEPTFTSIASAPTPAASFFDRIDAVISEIDSTVAVTSRTA